MQYLVLARVRVFEGPAQKTDGTSVSPGGWSEWRWTDASLCDSEELAIEESRRTNAGGYGPSQETEWDSRIVQLDHVLKLPQQRARVVMEEVVPGE